MKGNGLFILATKFKLSRINPYVAYDYKVAEFDVEILWFRQVNEPYYPCLKYRISADKNIDGTDQLVIAESVPDSGLILALRDSELILSKSFIQ